MIDIVHCAKCMTPLSCSKALNCLRLGADQPMPLDSDSPPMHDLLEADIRARKALGISRYLKALQAHNGRDALRDVYEELLDAAVYMRQVIFERDGK